MLKNDLKAVYSCNCLKLLYLFFILNKFFVQLNCDFDTKNNFQFKQTIIIRVYKSIFCEIEQINLYRLPKLSIL